jgi:hypothetical protein
MILKYSTRFKKGISSPKFIIKLLNFGTNIQIHCLIPDASPDYQTCTVPRRQSSTNPDTDTQYCISRDSPPTCDTVPSATSNSIPSGNQPERISDIFVDAMTLSHAAKELGKWCDSLTGVNGSSSVSLSMFH